MKVQGELGDIVKFQISRNIINLYKSFLVMLEDLEYEHETHFNKLKSKLSAEIDVLDQADYLDAPKMEHLRKRVLDSGNHCIREIMSTLEQCNFISSTRE